MKLAEAVWTKRNNHEYLKQIALYKDQRELEQEARNEIRRIKHDLKQSMVYLSNLLAHQEYGKMKEVLDSLYGELEEKSCMKGRTGNLALDSLASCLVQESKKHGITLHMDMDINETIQMEDVEICAMAGNLFDNALEASERIPEGREIWVSMSYSKGDREDSQRIQYAHARLDGQLQLCPGRLQHDGLCRCREAAGTGKSEDGL